MGQFKLQRHALAAAVAIATLLFSAVPSFVLAAQASTKSASRSVVIAKVSADHGKKLTPEQQAKKYYAGKSVTIAAIPPVGGIFDDSARLLQPSLQTLLGTTVNVVDYGPGPPPATEDYANASAPNGLTLGMQNVAGGVINGMLGLPYLNFNPEHVDMLGANGASPSVLVAAPSSGITNINQLAKATSTYTIPAASGGSVWATDSILSGLFKFHWNILTDYSGTSAALAGFQRGDGKIYLGTVSSLSTEIETGAVVPLLLTLPCPKGFATFSKLKNVPTVAQFEAKHVLKGKTLNAYKAFDEMLSLGGTLYFVPTKTPVYLVTALRNALAKGFGKSHAAAAEALGLGVGFITGVQAKADYINITKVAPQFKPYFAS